MPNQPSSCPGTGGRNCLRHVHTHSVDQSISGMRNVAGHLENMVNTNVTYSVSQSDRAKHDNAVPQHSRTGRWGTGCWYWWWVQRRRRGSARGVCTGAAAGGMCKPDGGYGLQKTAPGKPRTGRLDHRRRSLTLERGWTVVAKQRRALRGKEAARQGLGRPEGEARAVGTAGTLVAASSVGQGCQHHGGRSPVAPVLVGQRSAGLCTPEGGGGGERDYGAKRSRRPGPQNKGLPIYARLVSAAAAPGSATEGVPGEVKRAEAEEAECATHLRHPGQRQGVSSRCSWYLRAELNKPAAGAHFGTTQHPRWRTACCSPRT